MLAKDGAIALSENALAALPTRDPLLVVEGLHTRFWTGAGTVHAVQGVSFTVNQRETLGMVGESGCGKSATAMSILRLLPRGKGEVVSGSVRFGGRNLLTSRKRELRRVRVRGISAIFQDASTALNPLITIGAHLHEALRIQGEASSKSRRDRALELLRDVGIAEPERVLRAYPYQLSGGMKQRVMIAIALSGTPQMIIADEPTTALDVTVQAQILALLKDLTDRSNLATLLITHDMGVVAGHTDRTLVMYAGRIVEDALTADLFARPRHPYTAALLSAVPRLDRRAPRLETIEGAPPNLVGASRGCPFAPRCSYVTQTCRDEDPPLELVGDRHQVACWVKPDLA